MLKSLCLLYVEYKLLFATPAVYMSAAFLSSSLRPPLCDLSEKHLLFLSTRSSHLRRAGPKTHANLMQISYNWSRRRVNERQSLIICQRGALSLTSVSSNVTEGQRTRNHWRHRWGFRQHLPWHVTARTRSCAHDDVQIHTNASSSVSHTHTHTREHEGWLSTACVHFYNKVSVEASSSYLLDKTCLIVFSFNVKSSCDESQPVDRGVQSVWNRMPEHMGQLQGGIAHCSTTACRKRIREGLYSLHRFTFCCCHVQCSKASRIEFQVQINIKCHSLSLLNLNFTLFLETA